MPASSFQSFIEIVQTVKEKWSTQYFSTIHYIVFLLLIVFFFFAIIIKKADFSRVSKEILHLTSIIFIGCFLFTILMIRQFPAHDYYFLDTFFLPVIMLFTFILSVIPKPQTKLATIIFTGFILIVGIMLAYNAVGTQHTRRNTNSGDKTMATINNFTGTAAYLDSLNIPENAKMLVVPGYAPNIPFILMNRKGYSVMNINGENIKNALKWDYDYIVMQNEFFISDVYAHYPEIISKISRVWDNGNILICRHNEKDNDQNLGQFLGLNEMTPVLEKIMDYETAASEGWSNVTSTSDVFYSGNHAGTLTQDMKYGITYSTKNLPELKEKERLLYFQSWFRYDTINDVKLVVDVREGDEHIYYQTTDLQNLLKNKNTWEKISLLFKLPKVNSDNYELGLYLWNIKGSSLYIDDFEIRIY